MEDLKLYEKSWLDHLEKWTEAPHRKWNFGMNPGDKGMLEDPGKDGKFKNILGFKGTVLKTQRFFVFRKKEKKTINFTYS
jgi:hypothetical protein